MKKMLAIILMIGLAGVMLCGFISMPMDHSMEHSTTASTDVHFSMWTEMSNALVSNFTVAIAAMISISLLAYYSFKILSLSLLNTVLVYERIPVDRHRVLGRQSRKYSRWLSLFENSPSLS